MCGINGIINTSVLNPVQLVLSMNECIAYRGPDGEGVIGGRGYSIGCRRLAIVDTKNKLSDQPMIYNELIIAFNGEIYNYRELKEELNNLDFHFDTDSDTEVLLKGYAAWGKKILHKLNGQFAFAIYNTETSDIFLARDRTGMKPLYYALKNGELQFSSLPSALLLNFPFDPNLNAIASFFLCHVSFVGGEEPLGISLYKGIESIKPGEYMCGKNGRYVKKKYYSLPIIDIKHHIPVNKSIQKLQQIVEQAILKRIPSEVSLGSGLSGGLDSSIVTAVAADHYPNEIIAACIRFANQKNNVDYEHALILAESRSNIRLVPSELSPDNFLDDLEELVLAMGPHESIRELGMFRNYKTLKKNHVKVVLVGEGSDEFNWGYWFDFPGLYRDQKICRTKGLLHESIQHKIFFVKQLFTKEAQKSIDFIGLTDYIPIIYESFKTNDPTRKMMGVFATIFLEFLNRANDRSGMYHSLESRCPFQDVDVIKIATQIPREYQLQDKTEKYILRQAFKNILPKEIWNRRKYPLPAAAHLDYHIVIANTFDRWLDLVNNSFWTYFNQDSFVRIRSSYLNRIHYLSNKYSDPEVAGANLMRYRSMEENIDIGNGDTLTTNDVFQLLTTMIWYDQQINQQERRKL